MSNLQFFNLVGKREVKVADESTVMLEPTRGNFRLYPEVAKTLGVTDGSFVTVQEAEVDGAKVIFIGKGKDGVTLKDENGNDKIDDRGRRVYEKGNEGFGASAREITPGTNVFRFSVSSGWEALGGDTNKRKSFKLGEGVEVTLSIGDGERLTTVLYPLEFVKEEPKLARDKAAASEGTHSDEEPVSAIHSEQTSEAFEEEEL